MIKGISVCNPIDIEEEYLLLTVNYAIAKKYNHIQYIGPIHDAIKGNIDGMTEYKKYHIFNDEKDMEYVRYCQNAVNKACEKASANGIKNYMWHHELELPIGFEKAYPSTLNGHGEIEITAIEIKDFLINKIEDFFAQYPKMDGIILTLHETRVPLLKLSNQKLDKIERVKYITKILYDTCKKLGKELIVRPFASVEEDYQMMTKAYEEISKDMIIMDKWTQFDWSLTLPDNQFFNKIKNNPLLIEADIFGEYFGKGKFPLMLKNHIKNKFSYCNKFNPIGYCSRIDRNNAHPFNSANEVNLVIMNAYLNDLDVDKEIDDFFNERYGIYGKEIRDLLENTEEILTKIIYLKGYYFSELSRFPRLNHSKNHFYFEMQKKDFSIASDEWFIPKNWIRGSLDSIIEEKNQAISMSKILLEKCEKFKNKLKKSDYDTLHKQFLNLYYCANIWRVLVDIYRNYIAFFDEKDFFAEKRFFDALDKLSILNEEGEKNLPNEFYCRITDQGYQDRICEFIEEITKSFYAEKQAIERLKDKNIIDYIICGGANEGHNLKKEVNFSDTFIIDDKLCRIPGTKRGASWCTINSHGWFSYEIKVKKDAKNIIEVLFGNVDNKLDVKVTINDEEHIISKAIDGDYVHSFEYITKKDSIRIRFDRISGFTPLIYQIIVK